MLKRRYRFDEGWQTYVPDGWEETTEAAVIVEGHMEPLDPLEGPLAPEVELGPHAAPCACNACLEGESEMTKGQRMADYLKAARLWDRGP